LINARLTTNRLLIRPLEMDDAARLLDYVQDNRTWLEPWEPYHPLAYFSLEGQRSILEQCQDERHADTGVLMGVFQRSGNDRLCGRISITGIVRGIWQNGFVGYSIAQDCAGQGYMTEALGRLMDHAFGEMGLHRLQASIIPHNKASLRVLQKCGFRHEGRALRYLLIGDDWADHDLYAITSDEWGVEGFLKS